MCISFANLNDRPSLELLWRECFGEEGEYLNLYFSKRFSPDETLVYRQGGQIKSMLTLMPCEYKLLGKTYSCSYLFALATLPEAAGNGLGTKLLYEADQILLSRGVELAVLVPASESLYDFYSLRGYEPYFIERRCSFPPILNSQKAENIAILNEINPAQYRKKRLELLADNFIDWDEKTLDFAMQESKLAGGGLYQICHDNGKAWGICHLYCFNNIIFKELICEDSCEDSCENSEEELIKSLRQIYSHCKTNFRLRANNNKNKIKTSGMAKWYVPQPEQNGGYLSFILD